MIRRKNSDSTRATKKYAYIDLGTGAIFAQSGYSIFPRSQAQALVRDLRARGYKSAKAVPWGKGSALAVRGKPQVAANPGRRARGERQVYMVNAYDPSNPDARPDIAVNLSLREARRYATYYASRYRKHGFWTEVVSQDTGRVVCTINKPRR